MKLKVFYIFLISFSFSCSNEPDSDDFEGLFEKVWQDFDKTYSYFDLKGVDWDSVYTQHRPNINNEVTSVSELGDVIREMSLSLKDLHVYVRINGIIYQYNNSDLFEKNYPDNAVNYLSSISTNSNTLTIGDVEDSNILYVRVKNLSNSGDFDPLETVLSTLPSKDGLILDLRNNGGGNDAIGRDFVNRLTKEERVFRLIRFRNGPGRNDFEDWTESKISPENPIDYENPIVVLTNRHVVSSAEGFTSMMRVLPNTTILGDTTRGSTGNPMEFELSNSWTYRISSWQVVSPDIEFIEDHGIAPDIVVFNTEETMNEGRDLIMEKAMELLQ